ncbi:hypothetical protein J3R82DRAFT_11536 [Butyriboletus roseoflavus]|nr:hypothetical protein J3R82DRAFT_11536 [Butyriboletus roseoflavus]
MNNIPSSSPPAVPSIRIHDADDASALFDAGQMFSTDICNFYNLVPEDTALYTCSGLQPEYYPNAIPHPSAELEDIPELSHLTTTNQVYLTGHGYSVPYPTILQEPGATTSADGRLSPSTLGSPIHSPTSSFGSSLSPSSLYDSFALSDSESPLPPSPATPDQQFFWPSQGLNHHSSDSLVLHPSMESFSDDSVPSSSLGPEFGPQRPRSTSSISSRPGPVATKAMLEANSRRRRHPAQFECPECGQTFTALFSLKREFPRILLRGFNLNDATS